MSCSAFSSRKVDDRNASRREFLVGGALGSAALIAALIDWRFQSAMPAMRRFEDIIPGRLGPWQRSLAGDVAIPTAETPGDGAYDEVITRQYVDQSGALILLLLAHGSAQSGNAQLHRPETCYPASGFKLTEKQDAVVRTAGAGAIDALTLTAVAPGRIEHILYWSRIGRDFPTSSAAQRWATFRNTLDGSVPDGALVRISTINADPITARDRLSSFARLLLAVEDSRFHMLLTGRSSA